MESIRRFPRFPPAIQHAIDREQMTVEEAIQAGWHRQEPDPQWLRDVNSRISTVTEVAARPVTGPHIVIEQERLEAAAIRHEQHYPGQLVHTVSGTREEGTKRRKVSGEMNKTEQRYANYLRLHEREGNVEGWWYEAITFRLAPHTTYTPDFLVSWVDHGLVFVEIKGYLRDDASIKFKVAREQHPWAEWLMLRWKNQRWEEVRI